MIISIMKLSIFGFHNLKRNLKYIKTNNFVDFNYKIIHI
jgi:hypothetical protein